MDKIYYTLKIEFGEEVAMWDIEFTDLKIDSVFSILKGATLVEPPSGQILITNSSSKEEFLKCSFEDYRTIYSKNVKIFQNI